MIAPSHLRRLAVLALLLATAAPQAPVATPAAAVAVAQDPVQQLAEVLVRALAPATDDPSARVQDLLAAAFQQPRSPVSGVLANEAWNHIDEVVDLAAFADWLQQHAPPPPLHGQLQEPLRAIAHRLGRLGIAPPIDDPWPNRARRVQVLGPFGDSGRFLLDEPAPPDVVWPAPGESVAGRFGPVSVRVVERDLDWQELSLTDPARSRDGGYYVRWRVAAAVDTAGFVEVTCRGAMRCSIDGFEVGRREPYLRPTPPTLYLPVRLAAGEHAIVCKVAEDASSLSLRLVDAAGAPLAQVTEVAPDAPPPAAPATADPRDRTVFRDGLEALAAAAESAEGAAQALLRVAATWEASQHGNGYADRTLRWLLQLDKAPPTDPSSQFVLADLWLKTTQVPEEQRTAKARALEQTAIAAVADDHHSAVLARVRQFEEQDQREQALRLLQRQIDAGRAGPATFAAAHGVLRRLNFLAEEGALLEQWNKVLPTDARGCTVLADRLRQLGAPARAFAVLQPAFAHSPLNNDLRRRASELAVDLGDFAAARAILDRAVPGDRSPRWQLFREQTLAFLARREGDVGAETAALDAVMDSDIANASQFAQAAGRWLQLGKDARALAAIEQSLALDPDQPQLRELGARLGGPAEPGADFAQFRRDGDAAIAAFVPGAGENDASTTMLIDQRIVEVMPDGSSLVEIHELRRINDLQGVEGMRTASEPARADELLLLRTVGKDGRTYMPTRVENDFSMPRLEPGAFVEWRYRTRTRATGAAAPRIDDFLFGSHSEPLRRTEWIVILPNDDHGSIRRRNFDGDERTVALAGGRRATVLGRDDVARLPEEDSPPPAEELLPVAGYGEDAAVWPQLRERRIQLLLRTRPTPPIVDFAAELLADATTDRERLERVQAFTQSEIADGEAGDATEVLLRRKGNRFFLALALLRAANVPVEAAACQTVLPTLTGAAKPLFAEEDLAPMFAALVRPADGPATWMFPDTPRHWPLGAVPAHRSGALAFLLRADGATRVTLPAEDASPRSVTIEATCTLSESATALSARATIGDFAGYSVAEQLRRRTADVQKIAARQIGQQLVPDWRIKQAAAVGLEPGGEPLHLQLELQRPPPQADGDRWLLPLPFPPADLRRQFGDRDERTLPLLQTTDMALDTRVVIDPGEGRAIADLPRPQIVAFALLDYQLTFARDGRKVVVERRLRLHPGTIDVPIYPDWIRLLADIDRREQERLIVVSTSTGR